MPFTRPCVAGLACLGFLLVGGCQQKAAAPVAVAAAPAAIVIPPEGPGCAAAIARTQAVVESDVATENLNAAVGTRFGADLSRAQAVCAAGREGEALSLLAAAKSRYGYH